VGANFPTRPGPSSPPSLLYNGYRVSFPGKMRARAWSWPHTPSSAEVKEWVELYHYSPSGPSWPVLRWILLCLTLLLTKVWAREIIRLVTHRSITEKHLFETRPFYVWYLKDKVALGRSFYECCGTSRPISFHHFNIHSLNLYRRCVILTTGRLNRRHASPYLK